MGVEQQYSRFNLYDIFANFLPGVILIIGVFLPIFGVEGLFVTLGIGGILIIIVLAFAMGLALQVLGAYISSASAAFENHMKAVVNDEQEDGSERNSDGQITISSVDILFLERCRSEFELTANFDDWNRLYKLVLSRLERPSQSRALRIQALYLGMRGVTVTMIILFMYYIISYIGVQYFGLEVALPTWALIAFIGLTAALGVLFYMRQQEFQNDVVMYIINDYCVLSRDPESL